MTLKLNFTKIAKSFIVLTLCCSLTLSVFSFGSVKSIKAEDPTSTKTFIQLGTAGIAIIVGTLFANHGMKFANSLGENIDMIKTQLETFIAETNTNLNNCAITLKDGANMILNQSALKFVQLFYNWIKSRYNLASNTNLNTLSGDWYVVQFGEETFYAKTYNSYSNPVSRDGWVRSGNVIPVATLTYGQSLSVDWYGTHFSAYNYSVNAGQLVANSGFYSSSSSTYNVSNGEVFNLGFYFDSSGNVTYLHSVAWNDSHIVTQYLNVRRGGNPVNLQQSIVTGDLSDISDTNSNDYGAISSNEGTEYSDIASMLQAMLDAINSGNASFSSGVGTTIANAIDGSLSNISSDVKESTGILGAIKKAILGDSFTLNNSLSTSLTNAISQVEAIETSLTTALTNAFTNIPTFAITSFGTGFTNSANWVRTQFNNLTSTDGTTTNSFGNVITFGMILSIGLILLGRGFV